MSLISLKPSNLMAILALVMSAFISAVSVASDNAVLDESMTMLKSETAKLGTAKVDDGVLYFGSEKINDNFAIVDAVKAKHGGTVTLFVKSGTAFVRISTNVMKKGERAIGTHLDPQGPAIAAIRNGKAFYGIVDILGKLFDTGYEPIKDAAGEVVGIYYVGYPIE
jgi:hypothetical protein